MCSIRRSPTSRRQAAPAVAWSSGDFARGGGPDRAGRRAALRHRRPAGRLARARRRHRQRQRRDRRGAARLHRGRRGLRAGAARARPPPRRRRGPAGRAASRATPRRCRSATRRSTRSRRCSGRCSRPITRSAAAELLRVCRPGGTIALASWTPDGFIGELFGTVIAARPAAGRRALADAVGRPRRTCGAVRQRRSRRSSVRERTFTFRFLSAEDFVDVLPALVRPDGEGVRRRRGRGPRRARGRPDRARPDVRPARADGAIAIPAAYTEASRSGARVRPELSRRSSARRGAASRRRRRAELRQHGRDVVLRRPRRDDQPVGDLGVREPLGEQREHLELARGQPGRVRARRLARPARDADAELAHARR